MSVPSTATQMALRHGYLKGLRTAIDLANKMLSQTNEKKLYRLELIRLMNEPAPLLPDQKARIDAKLSQEE